MVIPALFNPFSIRPLSHQGSQLEQVHPSSNPSRPVVDEVSVSAGGRRLLENPQRQAGPAANPLYSPVPVDERTSASQSAETILGFIDHHLQRLSQDNASRNNVEQALQQALDGFQQGLTEAREILSGFGLLTDDVSADIDRTEQLVFDGLEQLRKRHLGELPLPIDTATAAAPVETAVNSVVQAYSVERTESSYATASYVTDSRANKRDAVSALAASYAESYQRNRSVDLQLKTRDGDTVRLSFSSGLSSDSRSVFAATGNSSGAAAVLAYQRHSSASSNFNFSVEGELDADELEALNNLLQQVGDLSEEFFNGDFETAFAMAMAFEMDSSEFSALSLDLARSTRASIVESYAIAEGGPPAKGNSVDSLVEQLMAMLEQAEHFAQPKVLLTDLLSNQLAQQSLLAERLLDLA